MAMIFSRGKAERYSPASSVNIAPCPLFLMGTATRVVSRKSAQATHSEGDNRKTSLRCARRTPMRYALG